jgi:hypothetical protein
MEHIAKAHSLLSCMVFLENVFILFNVEKHLSLSAVVIGMVQIIFSSFTDSTNVVVKLFS